MSDPISTGMNIAGGALFTGGTVFGAFSDANRDEDQARLGRMQANELERRTAEELDALGREGEKLKGAQISAYTANNVDITGSPLAMLEESAAQVARESYRIKQASEFDAMQLRLGAKGFESSASQKRVGGVLSGIGTGLTTAANIKRTT